ncbi:MAG: recombinase family protein [Filifactoraceae bacterium]
MSNEKIKVYIYTRVSTSVQIDGYSLEAQKSRMKAFALYNDYDIVGEYEDAGKSGKSVEGRIEFTHMMEDIKSGKDGVSFVLVFKLSRFARNAADVLSTLQIMQDFGVNLICVEDGIDSSKDAGKLMISVLSAVAEIERENIRVQTMEGRIQKAREGKWNGGFAPYGYQLVDGKLFINEEEAIAIRTIFDQYVNTTIGANGLSKYLENHGIRKIARQNGKNPLFDAGLIRKILKNPVYNGKIAFGRRTLEKVHGTRNEYRQVEQDDYLVSDGIHVPIVSDELWQAAQVKLKAQAKKYEHSNKGKGVRTHLLTGIVKCPICGTGMFGNKCIKYKKDGSKYKDFYYYGCKHRNMNRGNKCDYRKQIREELLDDAVAEVIVKLVSNPKFASMMQKKINMKVDTSAIEKEIDNYQKELRKNHSTKFKLIEEIDNLDVDDKHYKRRKVDLDTRLYSMYDKIEELESFLIDAKAKIETIEAEKLTGDNIYKVLIYFDKLYKVMNDVERRQLIEALISEIQIYEDKKPNGQWLKSITFKLPIIEKDISIGLDNDKHVECVALMSRVAPIN